jgi:hypothetical protein
MMLFYESKHLIEPRSAAHLRSLNVDEYSQDHKTLAGGILTQQTNLRGDTESFRLLVLA